METELYEVQPGDTWENIATTWGVPVEILKNVNRSSINIGVHSDDALTVYRLIEIPINLPYSEPFFIYQDSSTPAVIPAGQETISNLNSAGDFVQVDVSQWRDFDAIAHLPISENIIAYDAEQDIYFLVDGSSLPREELMREYRLFVAQQLVAVVEANSGFDPEAIRRDFLYLLTQEENYQGYTNINEKIEDLLLLHTAQLLVTSGAYGEWSETELVEELKARLDEGYTPEEAAQLAFDLLADLANSPKTLLLGNLRTQYWQWMGNINLFLLAAQLDSLRVYLRSYDPDLEQSLLDELSAQLSQMPVAVLDISTETVRIPFQVFYDFLVQRRDWLLNDIQPLIAEYEAWFQAKREEIENLPEDLWTLFLLSTTPLTILFEPLDWLISAMEVLKGDPTALAGFLPLIPANIGRVNRAVNNSRNIVISGFHSVTRFGQRILLAPIGLVTGAGFGWGFATGRGVKRAVVFGSNAIDFKSDTLANAQRFARQIIGIPDNASSIRVLGIGKNDFRIGWSDRVFRTNDQYRQGEYIIYNLGSNSPSGWDMRVVVRHEWYIGADKIPYRNEHVHAAIIETEGLNEFFTGTLPRINPRLYNEIVNLPPELQWKHLIVAYLDSGGKYRIPESLGDHHIFVRETPNVQPPREK